MVQVVGGLKKSKLPCCFEVLDSIHNTLYIKIIIIISDSPKITFIVFFLLHSFLFDVNSQGHKYYKNLVKCLRGDGLGANTKTENSETSMSGGTQKRKRKSRWDTTPPKSATASSSDSDAAVAAALAVAAEIEHSIPMSNKEEEERQKQMKEQQEVN